MPADKFHVDRAGNIVDQHGGVLYYSFETKDLTRAAKTRLAELHTSQPELDWEHADEILRAEGLL